MLSSSEKPKSVSFSNVPINVTERTLRNLFSACGHITGFRLVAPSSGTLYAYGSVDYLDAKSASDAVTQLNEHSFTQESVLSELNGTKIQMKVTISGGNRKRPRDFNNHNGKGMEQLIAEAVPLLELKPGIVNPVSPGDQTLINALRACPKSDAYEAVEQLRVLAVDRPEEAVRLFARHPQLAAAVVMILQQAGKIPLGPLPPEAFRTAAAVPETAAAAAEQMEKKAPVMSPEEISQVMEIVASLPEEQVEQISRMTPEDFSKIPDPVQRLQLQALQRQILLLGQSL